MFDVITILFLLLPIAFISGFYLARKLSQGTEIEDNYTLPPDYIKGLNFLLNEQSDKTVKISACAMENLIEVKQLESTGTVSESLNSIKSVTNQLLKTKSHYQCHL